MKKPVFARSRFTYLIQYKNDPKTIFKKRLTFASEIHYFLSCPELVRNSDNIVIIHDWSLSNCTFWLLTKGGRGTGGGRGQARSTYRICSTTDLEYSRGQSFDPIGAIS